MHRFILEPYHGRDSRFTCPNCNDNRKTFKRYIDTVTKQYLADHVGKCDRLDDCGYHYPPRDYFAATPGVRLQQAQDDTHAAKRFNSLPRWYVDDTTRAYHRNNFIKFLGKCFGENNALYLAGLYKVGTSKHWPGATIFWQVDVNDRVRTGKVMLYNAEDGHRVKQPYNHIAWVHNLVMRNAESQMRNSETRNANCQMRNDVNKNTSAIGTSNSDFQKTSAIASSHSDFKLQQCFFGEHLLLTDPFKTVAIVESEKTAMICRFIDPRYIWLASGSLEGLNPDKCQVLREREVVLFPDCNGYAKWRQKAREMNLKMVKAKFTVDKTLEQIASPEDRARGIDIADVWLDQITFKS